MFAGHVQRGSQTANPDCRKFMSMVRQDCGCNLRSHCPLVSNGGCAIFGGGFEVVVRSKGVRHTINQHQRRMAARWPAFQPADSHDLWIKVEYRALYYVYAVDTSPIFLSTSRDASLCSQWLTTAAGECSLQYAACNGQKAWTTTAVDSSLCARAFKEADTFPNIVIASCVSEYI